MFASTDDTAPRAAPLCSFQRLVFALPGRDDHQLFIRQGALQPERLLRRRAHPFLNFFRGGQDHRHRLGMNGADHIVGFSPEKAEERVLAFDGIWLGAANASPSRPKPAKNPSSREGEPSRRLLRICSGG
jgi:hypothetical protein